MSGALTVHTGLHMVWAPNRSAVAGIVALEDWTNAPPDARPRFGIRSRGDWWVHEFDQQIYPLESSDGALLVALDRVFGTRNLSPLSDDVARMLLPLWDATELVPVDLVRAAQQFPALAVAGKDLKDRYPGIAAAIRPMFAGMQIDEFTPESGILDDEELLLSHLVMFGGTATMAQIFAAWATVKPGPKDVAPASCDDGLAFTLAFARDDDDRILSLYELHTDLFVELPLLRWFDGAHWTTFSAVDLPASEFMTGVDTRYRRLLTDAMAEAHPVDDSVAALIDRFPFDYVLRSSMVDDGLRAYVSAMWSQFHSHPRPADAYAPVLDLAEWLDDLYPLPAHRVVDLVWLVGDAIRGEELEHPPEAARDLIEAMVGPEADLVFALHWINGTQRPSEEYVHVNAHGWRSDGTWDPNFPDDDPRWVDECQRLAADPGLVARVMRQLGVEEEFEVAWDLADKVILHPASAAVIVSLFDDRVAINRGLLHWAALDPQSQVTAKSVAPELFTPVRALLDATVDLASFTSRQTLEEWLAGEDPIPAGRLLEEMAMVTRRGSDQTARDEAVEPSVEHAAVQSIEPDYWDKLKRWQDMALELNRESQWAHACSWMLAARIVKSVDRCTYDLSWYPTGVGSVLHLHLEKDGRTAELLMNRAGSIQGQGFLGHSFYWDEVDPTILTVPWVWLTCMAPEGRREVLEVIHRGLGIDPVVGRQSTRQVLGFRLLGQILSSRMGDTEKWWTHSFDLHEFDGRADQLLLGSPQLESSGNELVGVYRGQEPRAWVYDGWLWTAGQKVDAYSRYKAGESLESIATLVQP